MKHLALLALLPLLQLLAGAAAGPGGTGDPPAGGEAAALFGVRRGIAAFDGAMYCPAAARSAASSVGRGCQPTENNRPQNSSRGDGSTSSVGGQINLPVQSGDESPHSKNTPAAPAPAPASRLIRNLRAGRPQTIVTFGTSLTKGNRWFAPLKEILDRDFPGQITHRNGAAGGRNSAWGLQVLETNVLAHKPDCVFIEFAINDCVPRMKISAGQSRQNMAAMIERIRRALPDCEIILQITNPVVGKPPGDKSERVDQPAYEQNYRDLAREHGLLLIDNAPSWQRLLAEKGEAGFLELVPDGVHPNDAGWRRIALPNILKTLF
ncbi:MAG: SGNH/GDSL hydrolase family protein [Opitutaceae bacterium]|nr:SGNH/GDSL hydrolase family protein [Opitutaceae bacterium]